MPYTLPEPLEIDNPYLREVLAQFYLQYGLKRAIAYKSVLLREKVVTEVAPKKQLPPKGRGRREYGLGTRLVFSRVSSDRFTPSREILLDLNDAERKQVLTALTVLVKGGYLERRGSYSKYEYRSYAEEAV